MAEIYPDAAELIYTLPGVVKARRKAADKIAGRASARLSAHRETGASSIVVEDVDGINADVILDDPASLSIEFGRGEFTRPDGVHVGAMEGLHILRDAIR